jgi:hypothetical protein
VSLFLIVLFGLELLFFASFCATTSLREDHTSFFSLREDHTSSFSLREDHTSCAVLFGVKPDAAKLPFARRRHPRWLQQASVARTVLFQQRVHVAFTHVLGIAEVLRSVNRRSLQLPPSDNPSTKKAKKQIKTKTRFRAQRLYFCFLYQAACFVGPLHRYCSPAVWVAVGATSSSAHARMSEACTHGGFTCAQMHACAHTSMCTEPKACSHTVPP